MTVYYVSSMTGSDSNNGTSSSSAFATIQAAADRSNPGDSVQVMNGVYKNSGSGGYVADITRSGTAGAPIVFEAAAGQHPVIDTTNQWAGLEVSGASYVTIKGFEITGNAASVTLATALSQANNSNDPQTSDTGIEVDQQGSTHSTHITIANNDVHDQGGAGIQIGGADYITVTGNTVYHNAWWSPFANSGISIFQSYSSDGNTGYKTIVSGNTVYGNQEFVPWHTQGQITDGNGIIIDSNNNTGYNGRTLVENNLTYNNGGTGAHAINSDHVDFFYNTAYDNNQSSALNEGQIVGQNSNDVRIENNIMVAPSGKMVNSQPYGYNVTYDYNIYHGGSGPQTLGAHDIVADPQFVSPSSGNFALQASSPAVNSATTQFSDSTDLAGHPRPSSGPDRGALEFQASGGGSSGGGGGGSSGGGGGTNDTLVLTLSADVWKGPPQFIVSVDGNQVGAGTATAVHSLGQTQSFTFTGQFGSGAHDVGVDFFNDAYGGTPQTDRNLYVNAITYDGKQSAGTPQALYSDGTAHFSVGVPLPGS